MLEMLQKMLQLNWRLKIKLHKVDEMNAKRIKTEKPQLICWQWHSLCVCVCCAVFCSSAVDWVNICSVHLILPYLITAKPSTKSHRKLGNSTGMRKNLKISLKIAVKHTNHFQIIAFLLLQMLLLWSLLLLVCGSRLTWCKQAVWKLPKVGHTHTRTEHGMIHNGHMRSWIMQSIRRMTRKTQPERERERYAS